MIEIYLLEQLDAFARCGTLSAASAQLHISQPALTRAMKKIEDVLQVSLFDRHKNRLSLNENGRLAAEYAARLLEQNREMVRAVQAFDRSRKTIALACCAPVPSFELLPMLQRLYPEMAVSSAIVNDDVLTAGLSRGDYQLIVTHIKPEDDDLYSAVCGHETLAVAMPLSHPLAALDAISFADLDDVAMLQYTEVGFWYQLCLQKIPHPHLLLQQDRDTFNAIVGASMLPTFYSDYYDEYEKRDLSGRKIIPLTDPQAKVTYYLVCRKTDRHRFAALFTQLATPTRRY